MKIKKNHIKNIDNIKMKNKPNIKFNEKWGKNISSVYLPEDVNCCLSLGPKFNFEREKLHHQPFMTS